LCDIGGVGGVAGDGDAADLLRDRPDRSLAAPGDDDVGAFLGEPTRGGGTDPGAATAHDRHLPLEPHPDPPVGWPPSSGSACRTAAAARYGFAAASEVLCSSRVPAPRAGGTRTVTDRSSWPQFAQ